MHRVGKGGGGEKIPKHFFSENLRENRIYIQLLDVVWEQSHLASILYFMSTVIKLIEKLIENVFVVPHCVLKKKFLVEPPINVTQKSFVLNALSQNDDTCENIGPKENREGNKR